MRLLTLIVLLFLNLIAFSQETPPTTKVVSNDSLVDLKKSPFFERIADPFLNDTVEPNKSGLVGRPGSTVGVGYRVRSTKHGQVPFGSEHSLTANYGVNRGAFFLEYQSIFHQVFGKWALGLNARADLINVIDFYGAGNETQKLGDDNDYQLKSREWMAGMALSRFLNNFHQLEGRTFFQSVRINAKNPQFINDLLADETKEDFTRKNFFGLGGGYRYLNTDNLLFPHKGFDIGALVSYTVHLGKNKYGFSRYTSYIAHYLPVSNQFTFASRLGGATIAGSPEFYQLNILGGRETLRGYRRQRFYGKSIMYLNNELRWLVPTSKKFFKQVGLLGFVDAGRVWHDDEDSNTIHVGYGGGIIIIPFNRIVLNGSYGFSKEDNVMHLRIGYLF